MKIENYGISFEKSRKLKTEFSILEENHLPIQMWMKIIERLKTEREAIITDSCGQALECYVDDFNLFVLVEANDERQKLFDHNKKAALFTHRVEIAQLYDTFIRWPETQIEQYSCTGDGRMFNIQGP